MEKENAEGLIHPSMLQIRYLSELAKIGKKRGTVALIACLLYTSDVADE